MNFHLRRYKRRGHDTMYYRGRGGGRESERAREIEEEAKSEGRWSKAINLKEIKEREKCL
jgi:hypothetical protein